MAAKDRVLPPPPHGGLFLSQLSFWGLYNTLGVGNVTLNSKQV